MRRILFAVALVGCASTELEVPANHPANAKAATPPIATSKVLQPDFDPFADQAPQETPGHQHHGGEHQP